MATTTEAEIFRRIFEPDKRGLSRHAARAILKLDFSAPDRARMNLLAEKARAGKLRKREDAELEAYIQVGQLLAIMQSKARQSLETELSRR